MEVVYIFSICLSIFFQCMGIFYCPGEASSDSCVFIIVAIMLLHKMKFKMCPTCTETKVGKFLELLAICLAMQVLLLALWFPLNQLLQLLGDIVCSSHLRHYMPSAIVDKIQENAGTAGVLGILFIALLTLFGNDDVLRFYGRKEDLLSESVLEIVAKQREIVLRRERMNARRRARS